jgi:hypothetical protein
VSGRDVDTFVHRHAGPVLEGAGFRNRGLTYRLEGPGGRLAIVQFRPEEADQPQFQVGYGVSTRAFREFRESRGAEQNSWPHVAEAILHGLLHSPDVVRAGVPGGLLPDVWALGDDAHDARVGAALAGALTDDVLPLIEAWFDPLTLAETLKRPPRGTFPGLLPRPRAVAVALLESDGAGEDLRETLERLPPDDMVRVWVEAQLASRRLN